MWRRGHAYIESGLHDSSSLKVNGGTTEHSLAFISSINEVALVYYQSFIGREIYLAKCMNIFSSEKASNNFFLLFDVEDESEAPEGIQIKPETDEAKTLSPRGTRTHHILWIVGRKLLENPNTHSCLAGFIWALIVFKYEDAGDPIFSP